MEVSFARSSPLRLAGAGLLAALFATTGCGSPQTSWSYRLVKTYPHDKRSYTQGLLFAKGALYESTGREGTSSVRRVTLETGEVEKQLDIPRALFAEGLALHGDELIQLTWHAGVAHVFDVDTLSVKRQFKYEGEGWGLTSDGEHLIQSNGSHTLVFRDPATFEEVRRVHVRWQNQPLKDINELEYIDGEVWANIWKSDQIARIDPKSGEVLGWIDLTGIFDHSTIPDEDAVLNGIAWDAETGRVFVTGKLWPHVFEIELVEE